MKIVTSKGKTIVTEDIFQALSVILIICLCVQGVLFLKDNSMQIESIVMTAVFLVMSLYFGFRKEKKDETQEN